VSKARVVKSTAPAVTANSSARVTTPEELLRQARQKLAADKKAGVLSESQIAAKEAQIKELEKLVGKKER
jgi:hypothetical protein